MQQPAAWPYLAGIILSLVVVGVFIYYMTSITAKIIAKERQTLLILVVFAFSSMLSIFIVDKIVAFKIELLTPTESGAIFGLIKDLSLIVFGYYFGSQKKT